jgi:YD repeat-containing protein
MIRIKRYSLFLMALMLACSGEDKNTLVAGCKIMTWSWAASDGQFQSQMTFTYSGSRVTSFVSVQEEQGKGGPETRIVSLTYDAQGQLIQLSSDSQTWTVTYGTDGLPDKISSDDGKVVDFTFNSQKQLTRMDQSLDIFDYADVFSYSGSTRNYTQWKFLVNDMEESNYIFQYDTKTNMFASLGMLPYFYGDLEAGRTDNNVTLETDVSANGFPPRTTTYQYNDKGYPVSYSTSNSGGVLLTGVATYNCD